MSPSDAACEETTYRLPESANRRGESRTWAKTLKMAALIPMPRASIKTAVVLNPSERRIMRSAYRRIGKQVVEARPNWQLSKPAHWAHLQRWKSLLFRSKHRKLRAISAPKVMRPKINALPIPTRGVVVHRWQMVVRKRTKRLLTLGFVAVAEHNAT